MTHFIAGDEPIVFAEEMQLRDYFAAKMIQANYLRNNLADGYIDVMCKEAYQYADAMMKARDNGTT